MDFITENYVWIIVAGVIILMAIIGYIADKTDFGRKGKTEKTEEKKKEKVKKNKDVKPTKIEVDAKGINELSQDIAGKNLQVDNNQIGENSSDNTSSFVPPITESSTIPVDQSFIQPTANETVDQSLFAPLTEQSVPNVDSQPMNNNQAVDNNAVNEVVNEEPQTLENNQTEELQNINPVTLPNENQNNNGQVSEEEDIWKF